MADQKNNPSSTSNSSRNQGTLGGAGAGLLDCYVQDGFVYNAKTNTQIGRITEKNPGQKQNPTGGSSSFSSA